MPVHISELEMVLGATAADGGMTEARPLIQDLSMLVLLDARERTLAEFKTLFTAAGLRMVRTTLTPAPLGPTTIMEAVAA